MINDISIGIINFSYVIITDYLFNVTLTLTLVIGYLFNDYLITYLVMLTDYLFNDVNNLIWN